MERKKILVGSRASALALVQTYWVIDRLKEKCPELDYEVVEIKTIGDKILDKTLHKIGGKGLFVKEIETALLQGEIDMAVHSMKDVPTEMIDDLMIGAITDREDTRDVLISRGGIQLRDLPQGAKIGTSSLRRAAQLLAYRPDLMIEPIRGNIATRLKKMETLHLDGVILAAAGVIRMGWQEKISQYIPSSLCTPAVGQGALGIQIRSKDAFVRNIVKELNNPHVEIAIKAERSFMRELKGGCHVPIGAYSCIEGENLVMDAVIASPDGEKVIRLKDKCSKEHYEQLGIKMAREGLNQGGRAILDNIEAGD
ncbi:hydroxymethylbilane synthase [Clostridiaceae bacterium 35-E11]